MPAMYFEMAEQKKSVWREGESNMENIVTIQSRRPILSSLYF